MSKVFKNKRLQALFKEFGEIEMFCKYVLQDMDHAKQIVSYPESPQAQRLLEDAIDELRTSIDYLQSAILDWHNDD